MKCDSRLHTPPCRCYSLQGHVLWLMTLSLLLVSCSHPRDSFLNGAVEEASQDDIKASWGEPIRSKTSLLHGETIWIYRYVMTEKELDPTGLKTFSGGVAGVVNAAASMIGKAPDPGKKDKPLCFHYLLNFNKAHILKDWKRETCAQTPL